MLSRQSEALKIVCHNQFCKKIPSINIDPDSSNIDIFCSEHRNKTYKIKEYLDLCKNDIICGNCHKKAPSNNWVFFCNKCEKYLDNRCFYNSCQKKGHKYVKISNNKSNISNNDNTCIHNKIYTKYCENCKVSLCDECLKNNNNHRNHQLKNIIVKSTNEINLLKNILEKQEKIFQKEEQIISDYLEELRDKLKMKKLIFQNYVNNKFNGNAIKNLENLNLMIDQTYFNKIDSKNINNMTNYDKALSLYNFNKMCGNKDKSNLNELISEEKVIKNIKPKNYLEDSKNNIDIHQRGKLIKKISEGRKIYSILVLDSGNIALGLSNGLVKIYKNDLSRERNLNKFPLLLTIEKFKGRRINCLYQLKDKSLLCSTFSKIHHIELTSSDSDYNYLGTTRLSSYEIPKRLIEFGDNLIVSLGEKKRKKQNVVKTKSILRILNKINKNGQGNQEGYLSDNESVNSFDSYHSDWESIYSSEDDKSSSEKEKEKSSDNNEYEDEYIKVYKKYKNMEKIFLLTIFGLNTSLDENNSFRFVATSNAKLTDGQNVLMFYGITKDSERNKYYPFLDNKRIEKISCSLDADSICFLDKDIIGVALQSFEEKDFNGIAVVNVKEYKLIRFIQGLSIGIIKLNILNNKKNIFFVTNKTADVKKLNKFTIFEWNKGIKEIKDEEKNEICNLKTTCRGCLELTDKNDRRNKNLYYVIYTFEDVFILQIKI